MKGGIFVFGAGGHGKVVADVARAAGFEVLGFIDDNASRQSAGVWGLQVESWDGFLARRSGEANYSVALGVGDNSARELCAARLREHDCAIATLVHPRAVIASSARIGRGVVVMALAAVNPDATVEDGCIVNTGSIVEHDCHIGRFAHLSPNSALGGGAKVGNRSHLGLGSVVLPLISVGHDVRVGAGAVVHRAVEDNQTVVGVPARPLLLGDTLADD